MKDYYPKIEHDETGYWYWDAPSIGQHYTKDGFVDKAMCCPYIPINFIPLDAKIDKNGVKFTVRTSEIIKRRIKTQGAPFAASDNISDFIKFEEFKDLEDELTHKFEGVLDSLIIDLEDPNSKETPRRLAKMFLYELFEGRYQKKPDITTFPNSDKPYTGMIVIRAEIKSLCAHHWQPISGTAYIGIIPNGNVMGLSKYIRLAQWVARRGTLQEELCNTIADEISNATTSQHVGVYIAAEHGCCTNRGVNAHSVLIQTTVLRGHFDTPDVKKEFFDNIQLQEAHSKTR